MRTRRATVDDVDALVDLRVAFLGEVGRVDDETALRGSVSSYLRRTIPTGGVAAWVVEMDGPIVSMGVITLYERMSWDGVSKEGYVLSMYTVPEHRRRGASSAILDEMQSFARAEDMRLCLIALEDARPMYERAGFTNDPRYLRWRP